MEKVLPPDAGWTLAKPGVALIFHVCPDGSRLPLETSEGGAP
jgi:hypothetical protein